MFAILLEEVKVVPHRPPLAYIVVCGIFFPVICDTILFEKVMLFILLLEVGELVIIVILGPESPIFLS
jgi:hypothetical protein